MDGPLLTFAITVTHISYNFCTKLDVVHGQVDQWPNDDNDDSHGYTC